MATIISKVTNAINTENSLLITQLAPDPSSARFNHQTARVNKRSIIPQLCSDTQYTNQPICRLSDWTGGYCEIQFTSTQWCTWQRWGFHWALNQRERNEKPQRYTLRWAVWSHVKLPEWHTLRIVNKSCLYTLHVLIMACLFRALNGYSCRSVHMPAERKRTHKSISN